MNVTELGDWTQFGLAGVVIFMLFLFLWRILHLHHLERKDWRESADRNTDKLERAISDLARSLHK